MEVFSIWLWWWSHKSAHVQTSRKALWRRPILLYVNIKIITSGSTQICFMCTDRIRMRAHMHKHNLNSTINTASHFDHQQEFFQVTNTLNLSETVWNCWPMVVISKADQLVVSYYYCFKFSANQAPPHHLSWRGRPPGPTSGTWPSCAAPEWKPLDLQDLTLGDGRQSRGCGGTLAGSAVAHQTLVWAHRM